MATGRHAPAAGPAPRHRSRPRRVPSRGAGRTGRPAGDRDGRKPAHCRRPSGGCDAPPPAVGTDERPRHRPAPPGNPHTAAGRDGRDPPTRHPSRRVEPPAGANRPYGETMDQPRPVPHVAPADGHGNTAARAPPATEEPRGRRGHHGAPSAGGTSGSGPLAHRLQNRHALHVMRHRKHVTRANPEKTAGQVRPSSPSWGQQVRRASNERHGGRPVIPARSAPDAVPVVRFRLRRSHKGSIDPHQRRSFGTPHSGGTSLRKRMTYSPLTSFRPPEVRTHRRDAPSAAGEAGRAAGSRRGNAAGA